MRLEISHCEAVVMDIKLNDSGDIAFINGSTPVTTQDFDVVSQRLKIRLQTNQSEYNFNTDYGVPWFQKILGKRTRKAVIDEILQQQIYKEEGVVEILDFNSYFEGSIYNLKFKVKNDKSLISNDIQINLSI